MTADAAVAPTPDLACVTPRNSLIFAFCVDIADDDVCSPGL